jgi:C-terminal processing protease CtpA/Prc
MAAMRGLLSFVAIGTLVAQQGPTGLSRAQREADLRQLARETQAKWAYAEDRRQIGGLDLAVLAEALIARLDGVADDGAFVGLVREFVAALQDGHASVQWAGKERQPFRRWPFTVVDTEQGLVVDTLLPAWNGTAVGLARGDLLLEVDGVPIAQRIATAERRTNASTAGARRRQALWQVVYDESDPRRYKVRRPDGTEAVIEAAAAKHHPEVAPRATAIESRRLAADVAYVRIPTFALGDAKAWAAATPAERPALLAKDAAAIRAAFAGAVGCRALVLDLRDNGGGTDLLGMEVAACLLPKGSVYYGLASRGLLWGWNEPGFHKLQVPGDPPRFAGRLVVLIDEGTFSVTDNLCRCLDDLHGDVTFVGRPTGGGTGAPRPCVTLAHSGVVVGFCTMRVYGPKGELIEGRGTRPDVPVVRTCEAVLAGRDEDLAAALRAIR